MRTKAMFGTLAAAVFVLLLGRAEAQLAKHGTYTSHFGWHSVGKVFELGKDHVFWVGEFSGTNFNDADQGFLHLASVVCPGVNDIIEGVFDAHGYCTVTDQDGDKAISQWKCKGAPRCEGEAEWTGGTGKYTGLKGSNSFHGVFVGTTLQGYAVWKGEWELP